MTQVKPGQKWEKYEDGKWRPVKVMNVTSSEIELMFLDVPDSEPDLQKTRTVTPAAMEDRNKFRFVSEA